MVLLKWRAAWPKPALTDSAGRLGGDEFLLLLPYLPHLPHTEVDARARALLTRIAAPIAVAYDSTLSPPAVTNSASAGIITAKRSQFVEGAGRAIEPDSASEFVLLPGAELAAGAAPS